MDRSHHSKPVVVVLEYTAGSEYVTGITGVLNGHSEQFQGLGRPQRVDKSTGRRTMLSIAWWLLHELVRSAPRRAATLIAVHMPILRRCAIHQHKRGFVTDR